MNAVFDIQNGMVPLRLEREIDELLNSDSLKGTGRSARLLMDHNDLHVLIVALAAGTSMPEHSVGGPALVQTLRGKLVLRAGADAWTLEKGGIFSIPPGLEHSAFTDCGCVILVVVHSVGELRLFD